MADTGDTKKLKFTLMKEHPLLGYALSFMLGAYLAIQVDIPVIISILLLCISLAFTIAFTVFKKKSWFFIVIVFLAFGYLSCSTYIPDWYKENYVPPAECTIVGTVESIDTTGYSREYVINDAAIGVKKLDSKIEVKNITQSDKVKAGDRIQLKVTLEKPAVSQQSGMFSEIRYYMTKDIQYSATVFDPKITIIKSDAGAVAANEVLQNKIYTRYKCNFNRPVLGVVYSLTTGSKEYIDSDFYVMCQELGIAHIFAISGLHIGALLILWEFYCRKRKKRFLIKILGSAALVAVLYLVVGSRASLLRAIAMWALVVIYHYIGIKGDLLDYLSLAMIGLMIINPLYVIDLGFILSVTCVGAIAIVYLPIMRKFKGSKFLNFYPVSLFMVSFAILSFSWIITAKAFGQVAILSPFWNVLFVPLAVALLMLILVFNILFFVPIINTVLIWLIEKLADIIIRLVGWCSSINIDINMPKIGFAAALLIIICFLIITDVIFKGRKKIRIAGGILAIVIILLSILFVPAPDRMEVFAGYDAPFVYISEDNKSLLIINENDGGIERVLEDIDETEIDIFIYSGNDINDLEELLFNIDELSFDKIIVHRDLLEGYSGDCDYSTISSGEKIVFGNVEIYLDEFRANKNAVTHYYANIDYYDRNFVYLDPYRLREGAIDNCDIVISSAWTKSRIENVVFAGSKYAIINSRNYLMDDSQVIEDGSMMSTFNINNEGSFTYYSQGDN